MLVLGFCAIAAPLVGLQERNELIVWRPSITGPTQDVVWPAGSTQKVTWNTADMPPEKQGSSGLILLGHAGNNSENLDIYHPLAHDFPISQGWVDVTILSDTAPRDDYFVVLFGDSGNTSPSFSITVPATSS
ncbi:hypothetical protein M378DRAFT_13092 [Amanita muscaria Koide BX008]|uniref:Yeast cell wall synthesis Kre9/Knh1-like N-terminal domain-containing protein n=1 Tax=Amanita muscaria (strain Koide BX008) TaxID=946122 RepID=A0A0C2SG10_AMAMK|nr:hypothetical protein M378DRAFT_13092 [Amanita muscaria Koide BX008]